MVFLLGEHDIVGCSRIRDESGGNTRVFQVFRSYKIPFDDTDPLTGFGWESNIVRLHLTGWISD